MPRVGQPKKGERSTVPGCMTVRGCLDTAIGLPSIPLGLCFPSALHPLPGAWGQTAPAVLSPPQFLRNLVLSDLLQSIQISLGCHSAVLVTVTKEINKVPVLSFLTVTSEINSVTLATSRSLNSGAGWVHAFV